MSKIFLYLEKSYENKKDKEKIEEEKSLQRIAARLEFKEAKKNRQKTREDRRIIDLCIRG